MEQGLISGFLFYLDVQALDFLIEGGERNVEAIGGLGLVPGALLKHLGYYVPLAFFHHLKQ